MYLYTITLSSPITMTKLKRHLKSRSVFGGSPQRMDEIILFSKLGFHCIFAVGRPQSSVG